MPRLAALAAVLLAGAGVGGQPRRSMDWPLHNLDVSNRRYADLDQINTSNVRSLALTWSVPMAASDGIASVTPLVVDGVMYFNAGSKLFAVDAATGASKWTFAADPAFGGGGRGPAYGGGRIYAFGRTMIYAVDAKTGRLAESFGDKGMLSIVSRALTMKYPGRYDPNVDPIALGYSMTTPPTYFNGVLYVGLPSSENLIRGGLVIAVDGASGAINWVFNTVPQGPQDDGWEIAKDTWGTGGRIGGGIWTQPAIDPELGLLYVNAANPAPDYDGSARGGSNLFTNSLLALDLATGALRWHFQTLHHDIWDYDSASGPLLFDVARDGKMIKGVASLGKTCYAYFWDRQTGAPLNPMVESVVPTTTDVPGEKVWPTQPIPYTSRGVPQEPFCMTYPNVTDPALATRVRPMFHPYQVKEFVITAPGNTGGANWGSPSFSPRTGLVYATGKNDAHSLTVQPVGDMLSGPKPGPENAYHPDVTARGDRGIATTMGVGAYEPASGHLVWQRTLDGTTSSGSLVTAGDIVFQGSGPHLYALDARSGATLFQFTDKGGFRASPLTYQVAGKQYVSIVAVNRVMTFALP